MSQPFRSTLVLMLLDSYSFGAHVSDPIAFVLRAPRAIKQWLGCCDECERMKEERA